MPTFQVRAETPREAIRRGCGAPIVWMTTVAGRPMCLDRYAPLESQGGGATVDSADTHWATCPARAQFVRKRAAAERPVGAG